MFTHAAVGAEGKKGGGMYGEAELSSLPGLALRELTGPNPPARSVHGVPAPNKGAPQQPGIIINKPICQSKGGSACKGEGVLKVNLVEGKYLERCGK